MNFKKLKDSPKISNVKNLTNIFKEKIKFCSTEKNKNLIKKKHYSHRKKSKSHHHSNQSMSPISQTKKKLIFIILRKIKIFSRKNNLVDKIQKIIDIQIKVCHR